MSEQQLKAKLMDATAMQRALSRMAHEILEQLDPPENIVLVGIKRRGVPLAQRLAALTPEENTGMEILLAMEWNQRRGPVSLEHLINLTYNTNACCLAPQVSNFLL